METQITLSESSTKNEINEVIEIRDYSHYENSVGNNLMSIQITTKYRYKMMRKEKNRKICLVAIEEACKRHKIKISIVRVLVEHVHLIVDCPRIMSVAKLMQIIKRLSAYLLFRLCPNFRKRYPSGHFWSDGYFCVSCGTDFDRAYSYIENQEEHHSVN